MGTRIRSALVAGIALVLGTSACHNNQNQNENANGDLKDLVVLQVNPPDGTQNVFRDATITVTFTAPVDPSTVNTTTIQVRDQGGGTPIGSFVVEYERVHFIPLNPPALLANTIYTVYCPTWPSAPTVMSLENTPLMGASPTVRNPSTFTTGSQIQPDTFCPFVTAVNPPNAVSGDPFIPVPYGASGVPTNANISVRFSEAISPASVGPQPVILSPPAALNFAFRLYDVQLSLAASQASHTHTSPTVAILIRGKVMSDGPDAQAKAFAPAPVGLRQLDSPGQWLVVPAGDRHHIVRLGTSDAQVVEVELR